MIAVATLKQDYQQRVTNVQQALQTVLTDTLNTIAAVSTINDIMDLALTAAASAVAAVTGVATTLPEAALAAAAGGIVGYIAWKVSGLKFSAGVTIFQTIANYAAPRAINYVTSKEIAKRAKLYPTGQ